jgi:hypothetical protein
MLLTKQQDFDNYDLYKEIYTIENITTINHI